MDSRAVRITTARNIILAVALLVLCAVDAAGKFTPYAKGITLNYVPYLIFQKWKLTNYRRNEPIYQLKCLAGCEFEPDWVKCHNVPAPNGANGPRWRCEADLPSHLQFSTLEVICEGYESSEDDYVLDGSCGLEYSMKHIPLPAPNLESVKGGLADLPKFEFEAQWSGCHVLLLGCAIYACCHMLYYVVQKDLHEALNSGCIPEKCGRCQVTNLTGQQDPLKMGTQSFDMTSSDPPKAQSWDKSQRSKSPPPFRPGPFRESVFKSPVGRPVTPIRPLQRPSFIHRLAKVETHGRKHEDGGDSSGSEFSNPNSPSYRGRNHGQEKVVWEGQEKNIRSSHQNRHPR